MKLYITACLVLFAAGAMGHAWAASYVEIDLTNTSPVDIDVFDDILYVLDDTGWVYMYMGDEWDSSVTVILHTNNISPTGILAYDSSTIYVLDTQGMVYVYGADSDVILIHPENRDPVAISGYDNIVYVADGSGVLFVYTVQPNGEWAYDSSIRLPVPNVSPSAIYVHDGVIHTAYVAGSTAHVFAYNGAAWNVPFTLSLENPQASLAMTSIDNSVYVLDGLTVYEYDTDGNPVIEYGMVLPATDPMGISVFDGRFYILDGTHVYESERWHVVANVKDTSPPTGLSMHDGAVVCASDKMSGGVYVNSTHTRLLHSDNTHPSGVASHDNTAYVSDSDGHVYVYSVQSGEWIYEFSILLDEHNRSPSGVTVNNGILYVVDNVTDTIYGYAGTQWYLAGTISLDRDNRDPAGIALYGSRLYVVDDNGVVHSYLNTIDNWSWAYDVPLHSENRGPVDISVSDGMIYVADNVHDGLYTYAKTWDDIAELSTGGVISDITAYNNTLYVTTTYPNADTVIVVYDRTDTGWIKSHYIDIHNSGGHPADVYVKNHTLMITDQGRGMYTLDDGSGQLYNIDLYSENKFPVDVNLYDDVLYVLDSVQNTIYVYDLFNETWFYTYHFPLSQYSVTPVGMTIDAGQMYVLDNDVVSVYYSRHAIPTGTVSTTTPFISSYAFASPSGHSTGYSIGNPSGHSTGYSAGQTLDTNSNPNVAPTNWYNNLDEYDIVIIDHKFQHLGYNSFKDYLQKNDIEYDDNDDDHDDDHDHHHDH